MSTITRTEQADAITYTLVIDGEEVSELVITADSRWVLNVETARGHERQGYATQLWEHANAEAEVFHALEHHRTAAGAAFADAVGGDTIDAETGYVSVCGVCDDPDLLAA